MFDYHRDGLSGSGFWFDLQWLSRYTWEWGLEKNTVLCKLTIWITQQIYIYCGISLLYVNTLRPRQNGRLFPDDVFKCIFLNGNVWISIKISLKFVPKCPINNIPALVQIMAWRRPGDKPLSEPMMVRLLIYICVTRPLNKLNIEYDPHLFPARTIVLPLHPRTNVRINSRADRSLFVLPNSEVFSL